MPHESYHRRLHTVVAAVARTTGSPTCTLHACTRRHSPTPLPRAWAGSFPHVRVGVVSPHSRWQWAGRWVGVGASPLCCTTGCTAHRQAGTFSACCTVCKGAGTLQAPLWCRSTQDLSCWLPWHHRLCCTLPPCPLGLGKRVDIRGRRRSPETLAVAATGRIEATVNRSLAGCMWPMGHQLDSQLELVWGAFLSCLQWMQF